MNKLDRSRLSEKDFPDRVLVEKFIPGHELTTTVMGSQPLGVTDILLRNGMIMTQSTS